MPSHRASILLVEDDDEVRLVLSAVLAESGYRVRAAEDGFVALAELKAEIPDIIVCDLNMPKMSGIELLEAVRRQFPKIPLVAMSGACSHGVPPGVTADAFYEKGSALSPLLQILAAMATCQNIKETAAPLGCASPL